MAYTTIDKPDLYFNTKLYTGTGSSQSITGVGFQPDFTWIKDRFDSVNNYSHILTNSVSGAGKNLFSNLTNAEETNTERLNSFDSDGFTVGTNVGVNTNSSSYVGWSWLAGGTGASNTDGTITSTVSANTTAGFSIVSYTANNISGATVGHGLGAVPSMIICKNRDGAFGWTSYHKSLGATKYILLNSSNAEGTSTGAWNDTEPNSSVFTLGNAGEQVNGSNQIAYCFSDVKGFSKYGSYTGNGSTDGTFVYTGFKPSLVITKCTSTSSVYTNWGMFDSKRPGYNQIDKVLGADLGDSENGTTIGTQYMDFLSNGFKCRNNGSPHNISGETYIYMCFAESPFTTSTGIPTTAR